MIKKQYSRLVYPTKLIKEFRDFFSEFIYESINPCIPGRNFGVDLKKAEIRPIYKNDRRLGKSNHRPLVFFLMLQKYMKDALIVTYAITLIRIFFQNTNVAFVKALVLIMTSSDDRKNENYP